MLNIKLHFKWRATPERKQQHLMVAAYYGKLALLKKAIINAASQIQPKLSVIDDKWTWLNWGGYGQSLRSSKLVRFVELYGSPEKIVFNLEVPIAPEGD